MCGSSIGYSSRAMAATPLCATRCSGPDPDPDPDPAAGSGPPVAPAVDPAGAAAPGAISAGGTSGVGQKEASEVDSDSCTRKGGGYIHDQLRSEGVV